MSPHLASAVNLLSIVRQQTDAIGVAVSFGKDSLATLDLCCALFPRVEAYYLYRVRALRVVDEWTAAVWQRHRVRVRMYPHFDLARCYRWAVLQPHWQSSAHSSPPTTTRSARSWSYGSRGFRKQRFANSSI